MKNIYVIKTGDTFPRIEKKFGDFEDWIIASLGFKKDQVVVINAELGETLPPVSDCKGVVIAGSHTMVTQNLDWSLGIEFWVQGAVKADVPILGICYGHQLIAKAMGGKVDFNPKGIEIGSVEIKLVPNAEKDLLFKDLPKSFSVHASHSQTVVSLPPGAVLLASNSFEPHHAFRLGTSTWGLQFHPEYDKDIMKAYIKSMASEFTQLHNDEKRLLKAVVQTPEALKIIQRFARIVESNK